MEFVIDGKHSEVGKCHCWKCRKVSGASSNTVIITASSSLRWTKGESLVKRYQTETQWSSDFCGTCGCPMPGLDETEKIYYVPAGLLDDDPGVPVAQHIYVSQKASWEVIADGAPQHDLDVPGDRN